jgi:hypothetical protein
LSSNNSKINQNFLSIRKITIVAIDPIPEKMLNGPDVKIFIEEHELTKKEKTDIFSMVIGMKISTSKILTPFVDWI